MNPYVIGISCIGSGVGQSIINSLKCSPLPFKTIGLGTNPFAFGAFDCDEYDYTESIYAPTYIDDILQKCIKHKIQVLIPGLDDEVFLFAQHRERFDEIGVKGIVASENLVSLCRDKGRMSRELNKVADVFVKSVEKKDIEQQLQDGLISFPLISKPRGGFASRGIHILNDVSDLSCVGENDIIQELAIPSADDPNRAFYEAQIARNKNPQVSEISIQLVFSPDGEQMGRMASYNKLNNGVPIEILPYDNPQIWEVIDALTPYLLNCGLVGPLNLQGRMTDTGLKLFEMNPRFTGISGLRALMGFNEVEACVKEWLGIDKGQNKLHFNNALFGIRQTADRTIPISRNQKVAELTKVLGQTGHIRKERVFITGATGNIGQHLVDKLLEESSVELWLYSRDKEKLTSIFGDKEVYLFDREDFNQNRISFGNIDTVLHLGFARPFYSDAEVADSLSFTSELFAKAVALNVPTIINVSSQSVYGEQSEMPWDESALILPSSKYGMAKYASELLLNSICKQCKPTIHTSVRLGSVVGGPSFKSEPSFLNALIQQLNNGEDLTIYNGQQLIERLDIRDAVSGLICVLMNKEKITQPVYNLGPGKQYTLKELADMLKEEWIVNNPNSHPKVTQVHKDTKYPSFGMKMDSFYTSFNWKPTFDLRTTIQSLLNS